MYGGGGSAISKLVSSLKSGNVVERARDHGFALVNAVRFSGEGVAVGAILSAVHVKAKTGLDAQGKYPIDAIAAVGANALAVLFPGKPGAADMKNVGACAAAVYGFRKGYDMLSEKQLAGGRSVGGVFGPAQKSKIAGEYHGDGDESHPGSDPNFGEDPLVLAARDL